MKMLCIVEEGVFAGELFVLSFETTVNMKNRQYFNRGIKS